MSEPRLSIIVAVDKNRAIGRANGLLWRIPEDLKRFKALTTGHVIIMGEKTHRSIGRALPYRTNIVLSKEKKEIPGCIVVHSVEEAFTRAHEVEKEEIFIIGGGMIYKEFLPRVERLYLTLVEGDYEADTFFPEYADFKKIVSEEKRESDGYRYTYFILER